MDEYEGFRARSNTWPLHRPDLTDDYGLGGPSSVEDNNDGCDSNNQSSANLNNHLGSSSESGVGVFGVLTSPSNVVIPTTAHEVASSLSSSSSKNHRLPGGSLQSSPPTTQQSLNHSDHPHDGHHHDSGVSVSSPLNGIGGGPMSPLTNGGHHNTNSGVKKNTSRRNAWGNMSYADLITQAIQGSPDKRLTLSQIYEWMVQNVPYFKDKGDSNSSAGWKNSIRHNLSLHNRFMRVQNEGTGKSSWWMINPDAKPGKAARRRATSMETSKFEKKRGRAKKKVEALRANGLIPELGPISGGGSTHSPSSSVSEGLDHFGDSPIHFNLSPAGDFRPRASSNASSVGGGRLSPIPAVTCDMHDSQVPPLSPIHSWSSTPTNGLSDPVMTRLNLYPSPVSDMESGGNGPYADQLVELANSGLSLGNGVSGGYNLDHHSSTGVSPQTQLISIIGGDGSGDIKPQISNRGHHPHHQHGDQQHHHHHHHLSQHLSYSSSNPTLSGNAVSSNYPPLNATASQVMGHLFSLNNSLPTDLDVDALQGGLECDVNSVIQHELSVEGNLDFNFEQNPSSTTHAGGVGNGGVTVVTASTMAAHTHSWVH